MLDQYTDYHGVQQHPKIMSEYTVLKPLQVHLLNILLHLQGNNILYTIL